MADAKITPNSTISLWLMVALLAGVITCTTVIITIKMQIQDIIADQYTISQASEDAFRRAIANPGHREPDPRKPGQFIVVDGATIHQ